MVINTALLANIVREIEYSIPKNWRTARLQNLIDQFHKEVEHDGQINSNDDTSSDAATKKGSDSRRQEETQ